MDIHCFHFLTHVLATGETSNQAMAHSPPALSPKLPRLHSGDLRLLPLQLETASDSSWSGLHGNDCCELLPQEKWGILHEKNLWIRSTVLVGVFRVRPTAPHLRICTCGVLH